MFNLGLWGLAIMAEDLSELNLFPAWNRIRSPKLSAVLSDRETSCELESKLLKRG